jgi:hypothetical protein
VKTSLPVQGLGRDGAKTLPMRFDLVASIRSARGPMIKRFRPVAAPYSDGDRPLTCLRARRRDKYERAPAVKRSSLADLRAAGARRAFRLARNYKMYCAMRRVSGSMDILGYKAATGVDLNPAHSRPAANDVFFGRPQPVRAALIAAGIGRCATRCRFPSSYSCRGQ